MSGPSEGLSEERRRELALWIGPHGNHVGQFPPCPWCSIPGPTDAMAEVDRLRAELAAIKGYWAGVRPQEPPAPVPQPQPSQPTYPIQAVTEAWSWYVVVDDLIGGAAVATVNLPVSEISGAPSGYVVANFIDPAVAAHVVTLHNARISAPAPCPRCDGCDRLQPLCICDSLLDGPDDQ